MLKSIKTWLYRLTVDTETSLVLERMDSLTDPYAFGRWIAEHYINRLVKDIKKDRRDTWNLIQDVAKEIRRRSGDAAYKRYVYGAEGLRLAANQVARRYGK